MRVAIEVVDKNPMHIKFRLRVNGALIHLSSSNLTLRVDEFIEFLTLLRPERICKVDGSLASLEEIKTWR